MIKQPDWSRNDLTYGDILGPAMLVENEQEAVVYIENYVTYIMLKDLTIDHARAHEIAAQNIGYYAGYYDTTTMNRVMELFHTKHPIFGTDIPSAEEAFQMGKALGEKWQNEGRNNGSGEGSSQDQKDSGTLSQ
jgi:hypothetical protein